MVCIIFIGAYRTDLQTLGVGGIVGVEIGSGTATCFAAAAVLGNISAAHAGSIAGHTVEWISRYAIKRRTRYVAGGSTHNVRICAYGAVVFGGIEAVCTVSMAGLTLIGSNITEVAWGTDCVATGDVQKATGRATGLALGAVVGSVEAAVTLADT